MGLPTQCTTADVGGTHTWSPSTPASSLGAQPAPWSCDLPTEFFILLRDRIKADGAHAVAAKLSQVSSGFYDLYEPVIDYTHLSLDQSKAAMLFRGVQRNFVATRPGTESRQSQVGDGMICQITHDEPETALPPRRGKADRLKQRTHIEIEDFGALRYLVRDHSLQRISKGSAPRFPAVTHVTLGEELIRVIGLENDQHYQAFVEALADMFSPAHLCVCYSNGASQHRTSDINRERAARDYVGGLQEGMVQVGRTERELMWRYRLAHGISHTVTYLANCWSLDSLTLHGIEYQFFPISNSPVHFKVFFSDAIGIDAETASPEQHRILHMVDSVELLGPPDECSFDFIGVGLYAAKRNRESTEKAEQDKVEAVFWERYPPREAIEAIGSRVRFLTREEAETCICCGGK